MTPQPGAVGHGAETESGWLVVEVDTSALRDNIAVFRRLVKPDTHLMAVVKADAYGHGLLLASEAFLEGGADILGVHSLAEARCLRDAGLTARVIILGPLTGEEACAAARLGVEVTVASHHAVDEVVRVRDRLPGGLEVHLKVETGVNRQGLVEEEFSGAVSALAALAQVKLRGLSSHFADIEDTTDHGFARDQMTRFEGYRVRWEALLPQAPEIHMSCSAAVLLFESTHGAIARVGVSAYGLWPSRETRVSIRQAGRPEETLRPAATWKCRISQVRLVPAGQTVGYGRTWKAMTDSRIAVLPVGYSDGWPRALSGRAHVLVHGKRAPLVGRVCMNLCMVDVTHIPAVRAGDQAVLLGRQGDEVITAEMLADHLGTIAYEVLTLPGPTWTRKPI